MVRGKHVLITGGAGFIGTHLCKALAQDNHVVVLDILHRNALQPAGLDQLPNVELRVGDVTNRREVQQALAGCNMVIHLASIAGVDTVMQIHNDGGQIRAWCYIDDIVEGTLTAMTHPQAVGHAFNIGNPRSTVTIYNLARDIVRLAQSTSPIEFIRWSFADVELRIPNIEKARSLLGYNPKVDLEEGLLKTIEWYRQKEQSASC